MNTLEEGKQYLRKRWKKGAKCPCCDQVVKLYKRKLDSAMVHGLVEMYRIHREKGNRDWLHIPTEFTKRQINNSNAQISKLKYWNLIYEKPNDADESKRTSGYWRISGYGIQFIFKKILMPKYVYIFNQKKYGSSDDTMVNISACLGKKFNYSELMGELIDDDFEQIKMNLLDKM